MDTDSTAGDLCSVELLEVAVATSSETLPRFVGVTFVARSPSDSGSDVGTIS